MPLVKSDALPLGAEEVAQLRARLVLPMAAELVERDDHRYLFVRSPRTDPDPVLDVDAALEAAPQWALTTLNDVLLLGSQSDLHVPSHIVRPVVEQILRADEAIARDVRSRLDVHYGVEVRRIPSDPVDVQRLLLHVPRQRCADVSESDLVALAQRLGPWLDQETPNVRACHLVAEQDALRLPAAEVLEDLRQRWSSLRPRQPVDPVTPETPAAAAVLSEPVPADVAPRIVEDVTPAFEIEQELVASAPDDALDDAAKKTEAALAQQLQAVGYTIHAAPQIPGAPFAFEARRTLAYPRTVAAVTVARLDRAGADRLLQLARESGLDLLYALVGETTTGAEKRLATSKVKVLKPSTPADLTA